MLKHLSVRRWRSIKDPRVYGFNNCMKNGSSRWMAASWLVRSAQGEEAAVSSSSQKRAAPVPCRVSGSISIDGTVSRAWRRTAGVMGSVRLPGRGLARGCGSPMRRRQA